MNMQWIIVGSHLALQDGKNIFHPNAADIYSLISGDLEDNQFGIICSRPSEDLPDIRFSKIGSPIYIRLSNDNNGVIHCNIVAFRNGIYIDVDVVCGTIIDQCIYKNTWFYLTGNNQDVQEYLNEAEIKDNGNISVRQYLKLMELELLKGSNYIINPLAELI